MSTVMDLRRLGRLVLVLVALALLAGACGGQPAPAPAEQAQVQESDAGEVKLDFTVWSYSVETIQDNIAQFEEKFPGVEVSLADHAWPQYHDVMAANFTGGNPPEVTYSSDHWLDEWVSAGWIAPIDQYCSELAKYQDEWAPYATQGMTLDGKLYGVPYYADLITFMYNDALLEEAGVSGPPRTLAELKEQALVLKEKGMEFPINIPLKKDNPWTIEIFYSLVYAEGGSMFDENDDPLFNEAGSVAEQVLQWLHDARNEWQILDPASLESGEPDVVKTMGAAQKAYSVLAKYNLAELNLGQHDQAGNFKMALMPGKTHSTVGFVRFYALTRAAADRGGETVEAACNFLDYFGGKTEGEYKVVKRWAVEKGLGFANLPLYEDDDVASTINKWGSVEIEREQAKLARAKEGLTAWWATWDIFAREQIHEAILGSVTPRQALQAMTERWVELKKQYGG